MISGPVRGVHCPARSRPRAPQDLGPIPPPVRRLSRSRVCGPAQTRQPVIAALFPYVGAGGRPREPRPLPWRTPPRPSRPVRAGEPGATPCPPQPTRSTFPVAATRCRRVPLMATAGRCVLAVLLPTFEDHEVAHQAVDADAGLGRQLPGRGSATAAASSSLSARRDNERASRNNAATTFADGGSGTSGSVTAPILDCPPPAGQRPDPDRIKPPHREGEQSLTNSTSCARRRAGITDALECVGSPDMPTGALTLQRAPAG